MNVYILFSLMVTSIAVYPMFDKIASDRINPLSMIIYRNIVYIFLLPILVWYGYKKGLLQFDTVAFLSCVLSGLLLLLAECAYLYIINKFDNIGILVVMSSSMEVVMTLILSWLIFGITLSYIQIFGASLVVIGIFILSK